MLTYSSNGKQVRIMRAGEGGERLKVAYTDERGEWCILEHGADENRRACEYIGAIALALMNEASDCFKWAANLDNTYAREHHGGFHDAGMALMQACERIIPDVYAAFSDVDAMNNWPAWRYLMCCDDRLC